MKKYPDHFDGIEMEIDEEIMSLHGFGIVIKEVEYAKSPDGGYRTFWRIGNKRVAFFTASWDKEGNQWQGSWRVFK